MRCFKNRDLTETTIRCHGQVIAQDGRLREGVVEAGLTVQKQYKTLGLKIISFLRFNSNRRYKKFYFCLFYLDDIDDVGFADLDVFSLSQYRFKNILHAKY